MKVELFPFQKIALTRLRQSLAVATGNYKITNVPQIVSYTAPTGAGKTIIMAALVESVYYGDDNYPDQNDAIFVWLSDSPQLNEQSRLKIETKAEKCFGRCVTISDESFDKEILEDGHIYFLNTQKLSKSSNLTKHADGRQYTIWETLTNTIREKSDRLYFIIDEAHRGAQQANELARATTIMQKFLMGSSQDKMPPMPVVIGMTATVERFNRLAQNIQKTVQSSIQYVNTTTDEVRASGLLKDRIVIKYPDNDGNDMAVLQAAADEWKNKWEHWHQYCYEQHYAYVNPILLIQVANAVGTRISATNLDECLRVIEERIGERFAEGQVVHAFSEGTTSIQINGLNVPYEEPSRISDNKKIKVVFFKETLSTGWDCPRAETMMSFRRAVDYTHIAQLLGRMIRTPMQMHINVDETLNEVHLFLPHFDESTVQSVVKALQSAEGATIPADVYVEEVNSGGYETLTLTPTYTVKPRVPGHQNQDPRQVNLPIDNTGEIPPSNGESEFVTEQPEKPEELITNQPVNVVDNTGNGSVVKPIDNTGNVSINPPVDVVPEPPVVEFPKIDRAGIVKAINNAGLLTYDIRKVQITDYLKSMYALAHFLTQTRTDIDCFDNIKDDIIKMIHDYAQHLKSTGMYKTLTEQVLQFKLNTQIYDVFGASIDNSSIQDMVISTETDIDRQFRAAESKLGNEGIGNSYCYAYDETNNSVANKIEVILFAVDVQCMENLHRYAKDKFHQLNDDNRRKTVTLPDKFKKRYDDIVSDGEIISKHNFRLPEIIRVAKDIDGQVYDDHLFVDNSGTAVINLNGWEKKVIEEEQKRDDYLCWLRNTPRASWALRIPYQLDSETKPMYPDFLIMRDAGDGIVVDILEPHDPTRIDNFGKAKGLAEYARENPGVGRIQLIKMKKDVLGNEKPYRLDMSRSSVREKVRKCASIDELNHIFDEEGFFA